MNAANGQTVFIETFGCQMNVLDSELVMGDLRRCGYAVVVEPDQADIILINTCSVRQRAEEKVHSRLGELKQLKLQRPDLLIGVIGCMAERDAEGIHERSPHVDVLCGPGEIGKLPRLIAQARSDDRTVTAVTRDWSRRTPVAHRAMDDDLEALDRSRTPAADGPLIQAYIRAQRGCDKFCSYCVVPYVRGPERSRPPEHIVEEARRLADAGAVEITLLGQTINSYAFAEGDQVVRLPDLLERVHDVPGIQRIRFVTSFPGDFNEAILATMHDLPKVCEYLHLPAQSGSNRVLEAMRRDHTVEHYHALVDRAREIVPDLSIAGDFIVGFSGETDEDFEASCDLVRRTRYKNIFAFKYSTRPKTVAERNLPDDVPIEVKRQRNRELLAIQAEIAAEHNRSLIGRRVEVLVEGYSKAALKAQHAQADPNTEPTWRSPNQLTGRTRGDQIVVFEGPASLIGTLAEVEIHEASDLTLHGRVVDSR